MIIKAQGTWLGQLCGDSLGSLVEFQDSVSIRKKYPNGITQLEDGGTWGTLAGQPTDDSEMALALARLLVKDKTYHASSTLQAYQDWFASNPFDYGRTIMVGLQGQPDNFSQANGALMRASPLGIFAAGKEIPQRKQWAAADAALTHPHINCQAINQLYVEAIATAIRSGCTSKELYQQICEWQFQWELPQEVIIVTNKSKYSPPEDYYSQMGWVMTAWQNALWQLLHADSLEEGVVNTVMQGGDTDTNTAICGALLGSVYGANAIPQQWKHSIENCKPDADNPFVLKPRPKKYWPNDAVHLAFELFTANSE